VGQLGSRGHGVLFGHVRAQLRHFNIEPELVEDGRHSGLRLLHTVQHRLRIADVVYVAMQKPTVRRQLRALLYFS
jgi:hypothetical protein